jgi:hypothetical protein
MNGWSEKGGTGDVSHIAVNHLLKCCVTFAVPTHCLIREKPEKHRN